MIPLLDGAQMVTDLEGGGYNLNNLGGFSPIPPNLVSTSDPRLTDARVPLDGSVTDASVAAGAAIAQSKLNLNGPIPPAWLGNTNTTAAEGDLAEYKANKGQPNGYASLDGGGKIPVGQLPASAGVGTVTSVGLTMPSQFSVSGSPVTAAGTLAVSWAAASDQSWLGNKSGAPAAPQFYNTPLPATLIPSLDASIVTSGVFGAALLPAAVGLGAGHAPGAAPDPGDGTGGALATDYLARDMTYKAFPALGPAYQPTVPTPSLNASANLTGPRTVVFGNTVDGVTYFYSTTSAVAGFQEAPSVGYISLAPLQQMWAYAARPGYNNSAIATYTNPNTV